MSLITKINVTLSAALVAPGDLADAAATVTKAYALALNSGFAAGQADRVLADTRTLTASSSEDLDLAGALLDQLGGPFVLARVKALFLRAAIGNVNNVVFGGVANAWATFLSPAATGLITLRPGAAMLLMAGGVQSGESQDATGYAVTAGTGDLLHVANGGAGTSVTYDIVAIGCSA